MERKKLASDVTDFYIEYGIFHITSGIAEIKKRIEEQFVDVVFVEGLIHNIIVRAKKHQDIDTGKLIELLSALERLRLELEYKAPESSGQKC